MRSSSRVGTRFALLALLLCALSPPLAAHLSFNLVVDEESRVYFLDIFGNSLVRVTPDGQAVELVDLRKLAPEERLHALAMDSAGRLYVGGYYRKEIWRITPAGRISPFYPFAGNAQTDTQVLHVGVDDAGKLYVMDYHYGTPLAKQVFRVLKFTDPTAEPMVLISLPGKLDFHAGSMFVADEGTVFLTSDHRVWRVTQDRRLQRFAGGASRGFVDGPRARARLDAPYGMAMDGDGNLLVAELAGRVRRIGADGQVTTVAGAGETGYVDGTLDEARFQQPFAVAVGPEDRLYVVEYAGGEPSKEYRVRVISEGRVTTLARIPSDGQFRK